MKYDKSDLSDTPHHIQSLGPWKDQNSTLTVKWNHSGDTSVRQPRSTIQTSETPTPDLCRDTGRHRARPASSDAKRRLQRVGVATTTTSTPLPQLYDIARRRNAETGSFNPVPPLTPTRIRQNLSLPPSKNGILSPPAATEYVIETCPASVCYHRS